jgi:CRP-like cAMP-binding protein
MRVNSPSDNRLLAALSSEDLGLIAAHLKLVELPGRTVLFEPGDDVETTHFPCRHTMATLLVATADGDEVEAATIGREGAIGGIVSAGNKPAFGRAVVLIPGAAFAIPTARLDEAKGKSWRLGDLFSRFADSLLAQVMQSAACNALHTVEQRACRWLLSTHDRAGRESFKLTQEALADFLGVQRTTVAAVANLLQSRGLISYRYGRVEVIDRQGLELFACGCYAAVESHYARLLPEAGARAERD